ncbi:MAG TPA: L,D-transpeptidase family protein [Acidimicrobiales bacterium]|nr:L,D-transpeptidase family protein [Acidimicrobiales bacterium]
MNRTRWVAVGAVAVLVTLAGVAYGLSGPGGGVDRAAAVSEATTSTTERPTTTRPPTTTTVPETTTTTTTTTTAPAPAVEGLTRGAKGEEVAAVQRRLTELRFDPGPADGSFGVGTMYAVQAFQKLHGMEPTGVVTADVGAALAAPQSPAPLVPDGGADRVEVDLPRQLLFLYKGGDLRLISHISSGNGKRYCAPGGCGTAITPPGSFRFMWRYPGWRTSRLGKLYNPVYFTGSGIAIHGATSVPTHPASHGCVRIPMHIAEYFPSLVQKGDAVYVLDGKTPVTPAPPPPPDPGPPPDDPATTADAVEQPAPTVPPPATTSPTMTLPTTPTTPAPARGPAQATTTTVATANPVD